MILTKNAGPLFRQTLTQIYRQQTERAFEVLVVDSGSTDGTLEIVKDFPVRNFHIPPKEFNFGLTRNYALSLSRGEFLVTISQDAIPCDGHWLENLIRPFVSNPDVVAVQGVERKPENQPVFYWERRGAFYFTSETRRWTEKYTCGLSFVNCAIRRAFWAGHPIPFTPFSEDKLFQTQIHRAGGGIAVAQAAACLHGHQYKFRDLVRRLCGEGAGWKYAGIGYGLHDCISDLIQNRWMVRETFSALIRREITSLQEVLFLLLRPICLFWGNRVTVVNSKGKFGEGL